MHLFTFANLVEIVKPDLSPCKPGELGRLLCTTLHNYTMPLLRYDLGDVATAGGQCDCGCTLPVIGNIEGRVTDRLRSASGDDVHGYYFVYHLLRRDWVDEFQVVQTELDRVIIHFTARAEPDHSDMASVEKAYREKLGESCRIEWRQQTELPRTPQGKQLQVRNLIGGL